MFPELTDTICIYIFSLILSFFKPFFLSSLVLTHDSLYFELLYQSRVRSEKQNHQDQYITWDCYRDLTSHNCGSQFNSLRTFKAVASLPEAGPEIIRAGDPEGNTQVQCGEPGPTDTCKEELEPKRKDRNLPPHLTLQLK